MEYIDMRKISAGEARQIRRQVVRLKKMGKSGKEIEEIVGVRQNRISEKMRSYLSSLQHDPKRLLPFFFHSDVSYCFVAK